jgi:hypothetical protein
VANLDKDKILLYKAEIKEAQNVLLEITSHDVNEFVQNSMMIGAMKYNLPCCCIKFGAQIHQTFGYQGTTLKSMSSAGLIKW